MDQAGITVKNEDGGFVIANVITGTIDFVPTLSYLKKLIARSAPFSAINPTAALWAERITKGFQLSETKEHYAVCQTLEEGVVTFYQVINNERILRVNERYYLRPSEEQFVKMLERWCRPFRSNLDTKVVGRYVADSVMDRVTSLKATSL